MNDGFDMSRAARCDGDRPPGETKKLFGWSDFILKYLLKNGDVAF